MAGAALGVAHAVERREHLLAEFTRLLKDGAANIGSGVRETRQIVVASDSEDVVQKKQHILGRGFVDRHGSPPSTCHRLTSESGRVSSLSGQAWPPARRSVAPNPLPARVGSLNHLFTRPARSAADCTAPHP